MRIYLYSDYRAFLKEEFERQEGGARGNFAKMAQLLGVHSTFVSLVFKGKRDLNPEQALVLASHLKLTDPESEFLLDLLQLSRAGHHELKAFIGRKVAKAREESKKLSKRFAHERKLEAEEREIFYSSWHYSAIRVFTSTRESGRTVEEICARLKLPRKTVVDALQFLAQTGLVAEKKGRYCVGPQRTYLERGHPLLKCLHTNWRQKALSQFEEMSEGEMMFTSTVSLSKKDFEAVRESLAQMVKKLAEVTEKTDPEDVACMNIDFFWVK